MEKLKYYLPSIIFNVLEFIVVIAAGYLIGLSLEWILIYIFSFSIVKLLAGKPKHYKSPPLCFVWTLVIFTAMFITHRISTIIGILFCILCAIVLTGRGDVLDIVQWKPTKYAEEINFVRTNYASLSPCESLRKLEELLALEDDKRLLVVYEQIFIKGRSWQDTADGLQMHTARLAPLVEQIAISIRMIAKY